MRIGIIRTPFLSDEVWKKELIEVNDDRPWLNDIPHEYCVQLKGSYYTSDDISIAYYLKHTLPPGFALNIVDPLATDAIQQAGKNDINFIIIYDIVEAYHTLPKRKFANIKKLFTLHNIFPVYDYQYFVNHKYVYYEYLKTKGINVLPFTHISKQEYDANSESAIQRVLNMEKGDDGKIIGKPVYGQDSIDFKEFNPPISANKIENYLEKLLTSYKGVIFQPYLKSLRESIEYKVLFVGDQPYYGLKYQGSTKNYEYMNVTDEPEIISFTTKVLQSLPKQTFKGHIVPRFITRVDVACCYGDKDFFVSEIEFVPSLFVDILPKSMQIDAIIGNQIYNIANTIRVQQPQKATFEYSQDISYMVYVLCGLLLLLTLLACAYLYYTR